MLKDGEKTEDLQYKGLKIIQSVDGYRFTTDAVLLANFVRGVKGKKVADIGCGSGIISILVAAKQQPKEVVGVEIQPAVADMAARSVELNGLSDVVKVVLADAKDWASGVEGRYDAVVVNPPYRKAGSGPLQSTETLAVSRHEISLTLEDVFVVAKKALKYGGSLYLVHQTERLAEAFALGSKHGIEGKELCPVCPREGETPNVFLARFVKGGKTGLKWLKPIVVFDADGNYSVTVKKLYGESFSD